MEQAEELVEVDPECMLGVLQNEVDKNYLTMYLYMKELRKRCRRICWTRPWILRRPHFALYDQLMVELRREDEAALIEFLGITPEMFDELLGLHGISPRITKQHTSFH